MNVQQWRSKDSLRLIGHDNPAPEASGSYLVPNLAQLRSGAICEPRINHLQTKKKKNWFAIKHWLRTSTQNALVEKGYWSLFGGPIKDTFIGPCSDDTLLDDQIQSSSIRKPTSGNWTGDLVIDLDIKWNLIDVSYTLPLLNSHAIPVFLLFLWARRQQNFLLRSHLITYHMHRVAVGP